MKQAKARIPVETQAPLYPYDSEDNLLLEIMQHYSWWRDDNNTRKTRVGGWDDVNKAYYGILPDNWPFTSRTVDPMISTSLIEKNARLTNRPMRGKVLPREDGDVIKARIQNSLVEFQWDTANHGGSMQSKISTCDLDSRMYASKFAYVPWKEIYDAKGQLVFYGNELEPLNIEDCGMDPNRDHIRSAKWFQHRSWELLADLEANKELYPGYNELKLRIEAKMRNVAQPRRDSKFTKVGRQHHQLEDRMGTDKAYPVIEKVVEYREDKWIIFCPEYQVILAVMDNPYDHGKIPIVQLRYYPVDGDNLGESEVERVIPLWKATQAVVCGFLDEVMLKMRPPLKVVEGSVRTETIVYEPEAMWLMDNINAVAEMETRADSVRYFQNTYPALKSAFNVAMGDLSQGISNLDPMNPDKTATEVRQVAKQQNIRDQKNQTELGEFIKDIVMMWIANNKQFLFRDPKKQQLVLKIVGQEKFQYFKNLGMDEMILTDDAASYIKDATLSMTEAGGSIDPGMMSSMIEAAKVPKFPVADNPDGEKLEDMQIRPKMSVSAMGDQAELTILEEDLEGFYDFVPDMKSMENTATEQTMLARSQAIQMIVNPNVLQLLQLEGKRPKVSDLLIADFEDKGLSDAQRFFEPIQGQPGTAQAAPGQFNPTGGVVPAQQAAGMGNTPQAPSQPSVDQQMALTGKF